MNRAHLTSDIERVLSCPTSKGYETEIRAGWSRIAGKPVSISDFSVGDMRVPGGAECPLGCWRVATLAESQALQKEAGWPVSDLRFAVCEHMLDAD